MWCQSCRQDVPGLVDAHDHRHCCPRCGTALLSDAGIDLSTVDVPPRTPASVQRTASQCDSSQPAASPSDVPDFRPARPPQAEPSRITALRWDAANWELNEKLRHVERLTATGRRFDPPQAVRPPHTAAEATPLRYDPNRFDPSPMPTAPFEPFPYSSPSLPPYEPPPAAHPHAPAYPPLGPHEHNSVGDALLRGIASMISWAFLFVAVGAFSCGGFLAAWGTAAERPHLHQLGMPIILGGMAALVVGLLPQLFLRHAADERARRAAWQSPAVDDAADYAPPHYARSTSPSARRGERRTA